VPAECVGLDIGSSAVKAVVLKIGRKGTELMSFGIEPLPPQTIVDGMIMDQGAIVDAIVRLKTTLGIKIKATATAISGHSVIVKKIQLPVISAEELAEQIPIEVEQHFPFKRDEVDIDYQIVSPAGGREGARGRKRDGKDSKDGKDGKDSGGGNGLMDVILVAAKKEIIADYMQVVRDAKLEPAVLDVAAFTIQNAFEAGYGDPAIHGNIGLFHVGNALTHINILSSGVSVFARDVTVGGAAFTEEIQRRLHVNYEAAEAFKLALGDPGAADAAAAGLAAGVPPAVADILNEVADGAAGKLQRSLDFFLASGPEFALSKIYLSGGSAHVTGLVRAMAARSKIPVEILDPFRRTTIDARRLDELFVKHHAAEAAVAYGLALRSPGDAPR